MVDTGNPGFWKLDVPFVWGPVGGADSFRCGFLPRLACV